MAKYVTDKKKVVTYLPKVIEDMSSKLVEDKGYANHQDVIISAIRVLYERTYKDYTQRPISQRLNRTPEERARDIIDQKKSLEDQKKQDQLELAARLNGEIKGNSVTYRTFTKKYGTKIHEGSSTVALDLLTEDHINNQFQNTTKEECEAQGIVF